MSEIKFPVKIEMTDLKIDYAIGRDESGPFIRLLVYDEHSLIALRDKLNEILPSDKASIDPLKVGEMVRVLEKCLEYARINSVDRMAIDIHNVLNSIRI